MDLRHILRFYFITDENTPDCPPLAQVKIAIAAGATVIQYRNKSVSAKDFKDVETIRDLCKTHAVPFIVNDHILLAKAVDADGVHLGQTDEDVSMARQILGPDAIIGRSVSSLEELRTSDLSLCDYIGTGPVFATDTKPDAGSVIGLPGLKAVVEKSRLPVVAIGGIDHLNAAACFSEGAAGIAVISAISRAKDPVHQATAIGKACGCRLRALSTGWNNEFALIDKLIDPRIAGVNSQKGGRSVLKVGPGDDAAWFEPIRNPVFTTDTQKENVHFRRIWQTLEEIGQKAVEITLSDLAAAYARPLGLFVNLSIPAHMSDTDIETLYAGICAALSRYQAVLGGGNISAGREFSMDLFAVGEGDPEIFPLRSNARPGDGVYVTGPLGLARAGLQCLKTGETGYPALIEKFKQPRARFDAAEILADHKVGCVMDISDGLAGDAGHIAAAANVSIRFDRSLFRIDPVLAAFCHDAEMDAELMMAAGGEDYELLFTCAPDVFAGITTLMPEAFQVGECLAFSGTPLLNLPPGVASFQHGKIKNTHQGDI